MRIKAYHKDLNTLHVNCEDPRAYYIPYETEEKALAGDRNASGFFSLLNGEWDFSFYSSFEDVGDDFPNSPLNEKIAVPSCWQTYTDRGYDPPLYSNLRYPFPVDPPYLPAENPCGHYSRKFDFLKKEGKKYFINFEGVSSCFYLFINGSFVCYSQVSHCTSEAAITDYLLDGENRIDVLVVKWCDGSYLEDQDMFRLSGIFRDVYILERDGNALRDIYVRYTLPPSYDRAEVRIESEGFDSAALYSPGGEKTELDSAVFEVENPLLWSSETPYLYKLIIRSGSEFIPVTVGFKDIRFDGNVALINSKPVKLYGINRHDNNPRTGYCVTVEDMKRDIFLIKQANCNTVRTSHYPNSPLFAELCDRYGIMLVDEADIETHGMGFEYKDTWDWMRWSKLSTDDEWEESYVDRAKRLFERDKNRACVIMWSLGNESGCGKNHRAMRKYIKSRDNNAVVHYENSHLEFRAVPEGENFSDISDVESRMYSSLEYTRDYAENPASAKPFFFCEYACSMTTGDAHAHADLFRKYPAIWGGCFWEFSDHAIETAPGKYRYGGDFGDEPNDGICCIDGAVFPDRTPRPGYLDIKKAYEPFECSFKGGRLTVFNRRYFTSLDDMYIRADLEADGELIASRVIDIDGIAPQTSETFDTGFEIPGGANVFLTAYLILKEDSEWAEKGFIAGFCQFELSDREKTPSFPDGPFECEDSGRYFRAKCGNTVFTLDKPFGEITSIRAGEKEMLLSPLRINLWKAPGNNEREKADECKSASIDTALTLIKSCEANIREGCAECVFECSVGGASVLPVLSGRLIYRFLPSGAEVRFEGETRSLLAEMEIRLPRFGFMLTMPGEYNRMTYFGKGPGEAYADRHRAQRYGRFTTGTVSDFVPYIKPIENGAHFGTREARVYNENGSGLEFIPLTQKDFLFGASPYTPAEIEKTLHNDELLAPSVTNVYLDRGMDIRGGRGVFEELEPERKWETGPVEFGVFIKAV